MKVIGSYCVNGVSPPTGKEKETTDYTDHEGRE